MRKTLPDAVEAARTEANTESVNDALLFIKDAIVRFHLFQGARVRVVNQRNRISDVTETELYEECLETRQTNSRAALSIDWKMKYEAKRSRESMTNHYGKRGMSWHEAVLSYYEWDPVKESPVLVKVSTDQILENGNKQDGLCVLAFVEALLVRISTELPHIKELVLYSDNAAYYHVKELVLSIPILNATSKGAKIVRFMHTETQDGKGDCDAHGAIAQRKVERDWLLTREPTENEKVVIPKCLTMSLACKGGLQNNGVQLIEVDRDGRLKEIASFMETVASQALQYFSRCNDILYFPDDDSSEDWASLDLSDPENWSSILFNLKAYAYSGIGEDATFRVDFHDESFAHLSEEELVESPVDDESECSIDMGLFESDFDFDSVDEDDMDDDDDDDDDDDESVVEDKARELQSAPQDAYNPKTMFTGANVKLHQIYG